MYSFCHYLRKIEFKGFAKWVILNECVKQNHPSGLSLIEVNRNNEMNGIKEEKGKLLEHGVDELYYALTPRYKHQFMNLTKGELKSIKTK